MLKKINNHTIFYPLSGIVVDIGCSDWKFAKLAIKNGAEKVIAFDADSRIEKPKNNKIDFINKAVVGEKKERYFCEYSKVKCSCLKEYQTYLIPGECISIRKVDCITIKELSEQYNNVFLLKLDCEGSEMEILDNFPEAFAKYISIEFHLHISKHFCSLPNNFLKYYKIISHEMTCRDSRLNYWDSFFERR